MDRLIFVPIERLEERYSAQWFDWFMKAFSEKGFLDSNKFHVVGDLKERKITTGQFLDIYETNKYKLNQIIEIIELLENYPNDNFTIFFMDAWFSGIEALAYIRSCAKRKIKFKGMVHAGTWDEHDFLSQSGCTYWAKPFEFSLFRIFDTIFYATDFHKKLIEAHFKEYGEDPLKSIFVKVDFPVIDPFNVDKKENIVVFPHRLAPEKNPDIFDQIEAKFKADYLSSIPDVKFVKSKDVCKTKFEYYELLKKSKVAVSTASQETFGIAMLEAFHLGCFPVVPARLSYKETFDSKYHYYSLDEACDKILIGLKAHHEFEYKYGSKIDWIDKIIGENYE